MKVAVTISYTKNWSGIATICVPNAALYCAKHGYTLLATVDEYNEYDGLWKLQNVGRLLNDYDLVFSFDCDTLITNHSIKLESFLDDESDFFVCKGLNMGVFGAKISDFSVDFVSTMSELIASGKYHCEQDIISGIYLGNEIKVLDHPAFNSYLSQFYPEVPQPVTKEQGQWEPGCFVLHVPALSIEKRIEVLKEYSQHIVYE